MSNAPSDAEIRASLYYAVGVASEGGRQSFTMVVAGDTRSTERLEVAGNSGYSIGTLQTDLGQRYQPDVAGGVNVPRDLVEATQAWARAHAPDHAFPDQASIDAAIADFGREGKDIKRDGFRDVDSESLARVNAFLGSEHGVAWVHARDAAQIDRVMAEAIAPLQATPAYRAMSAEDQLQTAVIAGKLFNQSEVNGRRLIERMADGRVETLADVDQFVNSRMDGSTDFFQTGKDHARHGAEVIQALRDAPAETAMGRVWADLQANPLRQPVLAARDQTGDGVDQSHQIARELFFDSVRGKSIVTAANEGDQVATGREPSQGAGALVAGDTMAVWGREGPVHVFRNGEWESHTRDAVEWVVNDEKRTLQLVSGEALVAMEPSIAPLRPDRTLRPGDNSEAVTTMQQQLSNLGYTGRDGQALAVDGDYGPGTTHAVTAFQRAQVEAGHDLQITGVADAATRDALDGAVRERALGPGPIAPDRERDQGPAMEGRGVDRSAADPMFPNVRDQVLELNRRLGIDSPETKDRVAAALVAEWRTSQARGSIDGVVLGQKGTKADAGEYVFAYSGTPERPNDWVGVRTAEAVQTPIEQSMAKAQEAVQRQVLEAQHYAQSQQQAVDGPRMTMS